MQPADRPDTAARGSPWRLPRGDLAFLVLLWACLPVCAGTWTHTASTGLSVRIVADDGAGGIKLYVERLMPDGNVDLHHGVRGRAAFALGPDNDLPASMRLDALDRVLVAGATRASGGATLPVVLRFLPDGTPDPAWGDGGRSTEAPAAGNAQALDLLPLPDGSVVVVGMIELKGDERAAVWRLRSDGRLDTSEKRSSSFVLESADASRVVSLTPVSERQLMLGVRVLADTDTQLEGYSFDPTDTDALPKLRTRQPWPSAWSDAPVWVQNVDAPQWGDPAKPSSTIAAVAVGLASIAAPWRSSATSVGDSAAAPNDVGGAVFSPYAQGVRRSSDVADASTRWPLVAVFAVVGIAVGAALAYLLGRPSPRNKGLQK
jgi:Domain of unknown function (DUF5122) beta-propeller